MKVFGAEGCPGPGNVSRSILTRQSVRAGLTGALLHRPGVSTLQREGTFMRRGGTRRGRSGEGLPRRACASRTPSRSSWASWWGLASSARPRSSRPTRRARPPCCCCGASGAGLLHRGHVLRGAGQHLAPRRRGLPLPAAGTRGRVGLPVRLGPLDGHPHRLHRAAGVHLRGLRLATAAAGEALLRPLRRALGGGAHRAERGWHPAGQVDAEPAHAGGGGRARAWSSSPGSSSRFGPPPQVPRGRQRGHVTPPGAWRWCSCC